jgi:hypothetical protein
MYYVVNVNHNSMQCTSPEVTVKGVTKCCISSAVDETDGGMLWNGGKED